MVLYAVLAFVAFAAVLIVGSLVARASRVDEVAKFHRAILLTTHDMSDVEQLCSRVLIIDHGTLLYDGTLDGIRDRLGTERTLVVDLALDFPGAAVLEVPGARQVRAEGPRRWLQFNRLETTAAELIAEVAARYPLHDLTIEEPDIESIVRRIYLEGLTPVEHEATV